MLLNLPFIGTSNPIQNLPRYDGAFLTAPYTTAHLGAYAGKNRNENSGSHPGVDIAYREVPIFCVANGVVVRAKQSAHGYGNCVVVRHADVPGFGTLYSAYAHLRDFSVAEGELIFRGEKIGISGKSGDVTGFHLHFQCDRESAPYHPYWPFTRTDLKNTKLATNWAGVNAKLGFANAEKFTVNPLAWIQQFLDFAPPEFSDTRKTKFRTAIRALQNKGFIAGVSGKFFPTQTLTRAEAAKLVIFASGKRVNSNVAGKPFVDCSLDEWFTPFVTTAKINGFVNGKTPTRFAPSDAITRAEFVKMVVLAARIGASKKISKFRDVEQVDWYAPFVNSAASAGILPWRGELKPKTKITRGEGAEIIYRALMKT